MSAVYIALIEAMVYLETRSCGDADDDVNALESILAELQKMTGDERTGFIHEVQREMAEAKHPQRRDALEAILDSI